MPEEGDLKDDGSMVLELETRTFWALEVAERDEVDLDGCWIQRPGAKGKGSP